MIKSSFTKLGLVAAASFLTLALSAQANHIDFLDDNAFNFTGTQGSLTVTGIPTSGTLGGQRMMSITALTGSAANLSASLNPVNPGANDDFMVFSAMAGSSGLFTLMVGAAAPLNANFLDIPAGGGNQWDRVRLSFDPTQMSSLASITVTLTSSTAGGSATVTQAFAGGMGGDVDFLHSAFRLNNPSFTDAAFRDVDMATFTLTGVDGGVYNIASFDRNGLVLIPEPSTYALLTVALAGAVLMARRRRAHAAA